MKVTGLAVFTILAVYILAFFGCSKGPDATPSQSASPKDGTQGYVGSERCATCHARNYHSWKGTKHANMLAAPTKKTVVGDFSLNNTLLAPSSPGASSHSIAKMTVKDGVYHVGLFSGDVSTDYEVAYVLGGTLRQMYLTVSAQGVMSVLPVQWNTRDEHWHEAQGPDAPSPGGARDWIKDCAPCHVTGFKANPTANQKAWNENGIGCEACHGPGALHANSKTPEKPDTIFNPGNYHDESRASMVCGRCHSRGMSPDGVHPSAVGYEPGEDLHSRFIEVSGGDGNFFWPDGSSKTNHQQLMDFRKSEMFSKGLKCWSCHNPHKSSENSRANLRLAGNALCRSCHVRDAGPRNLTHALHDNGSCVACHMPPTARSASPGDIASHTFKTIPPAATIDLGGADPAKQPNSCNLCHYHQKRPAADLSRLLKERIQGYYERSAVPKVR